MRIFDPFFSLDVKKKIVLCRLGPTQALTRLTQTKSFYMSLWFVFNFSQWEYLFFLMLFCIEVASVVFHILLFLLLFWYSVCVSKWIMNEFDLTRKLCVHTLVCDSEQQFWKDSPLIECKQSHCRTQNEESQHCNCTAIKEYQFSLVSLGIT